MTNLEKFAQIKAEAQRLEDGLLAKFMADKVAPIALWRHGGNAGVDKWDVTSVRCSHDFICFYGKKMSNEHLERMNAKLERIRARQEADPMMVFVHIKRGDTSAGVPWARLVDGSYGYYATREEAEAVNRKWHEEHDPRPDHFACNYCGKQTPNSQKVCARIFVNRGIQNREFCSSQCATHDQFASEG